MGELWSITIYQEVPNVLVLAGIELTFYCLPGLNHDTQNYPGAVFSYESYEVYILQPSIHDIRTSRIICFPLATWRTH